MEAISLKFGLRLFFLPRDFPRRDFSKLIFKGDKKSKQLFIVAKPWQFIKW